MSAITSLRRLVWRIHAHLNADRFKPDFPIPAVNVTTLCIDSNGPVAAPRAVGPQPRAGQDDAWQRLVTHFEQRKALKFIFDAPPARDGSPAVQHWLNVASKHAHEMTSAGLMVYGRRAPALRPGFPWKGDWTPDRSDVLIVVRPHRFGFAPRLALAVLAGQYPAADFRALLEDWMRFARRKPQLAYISTFLVAQRLLASSCAFQFLAAAGPGEQIFNLRAALLRIIAQDIAFLVPRVGKSYPNGHLLADRFIAWYIAAVFPEFASSTVDIEAAEAAWVSELMRQTYEDGGSFEHSSHYQSLAAEMAVAYLLFERRNGGSVAPEVVRRIERMLAFQADLAGSDGNAQMIGDGADGPMFPLDSGVGTTAAALREVYRDLFDRSIPPLLNDHMARERAFWLLSMEPPPARSTGRFDALGAYPQSGVFVMREDFDTTRCVFRTGPETGGATIAGHMHADLLSLNIVHHGVPFVVDPGTDSYRFGSAKRESNFRAFFAGPSAHSGVCVSNQDPLGPLEGDFRTGMSTAHVQHALTFGTSSLAWVEAQIVAPETYANVRRGVIHVCGEYFLAYTVLPTRLDPGSVTFPLQLDAGVRLEPAEEEALELISRADTRMRLVPSAEIAWRREYEGAHDPLGGWVSPVYGERKPALQLVFGPSTGTQVSALAFGLSESSRIGTVRCYGVGARALAFDITGKAFEDCLIVNLDDSGDAVLHRHIEFTGRVLWMRSSSQKLATMRAIDVERCRARQFGIDLSFDKPVHDFVSAPPVASEQNVPTGRSPVSTAGVSQ